MSSRIADALRRGRRDAHAELCVPALYIGAPGATPHACTVRQQLIPGGNGRPGSGTNIRLPSSAGSATMASAQQAETPPRLIFSSDDAPATVRVKAIVSIAPGVAYRIAFTYPPRDIFIIAEVVRLSADDAAGLPVP